MATSASTRIAASVIVPPTQNTAPVLEFRCLYTTDLRRKQKRWQDGILKFHTFNKRVMVYDDRGNFVGDTHWREHYTFDEGEELELERNGALVQVSECISRRDQDLTEILQRRVKERGERARARAVASSPVRTGLQVSQTPAASARQQDPSEPQSSKRRKQNSSSPVSKIGYAQTLTGATLTLSGTPSSRKSIHHEPLWSQAIKKPMDTTNSPGLQRDQLQCHEGRVAQGMSPEQSNGQANESCAKPTPQQERTNRASDTTAPSFTRARMAPTTRGPLPSFACQGESGELLQRAPDRTAALENNSTNFSVGTRAILSHEASKKIRLPGRQLVQKGTSEKSLSPPARQQPSSNHGCQQGRNLNPLRIKQRPKRKLLLSTCALRSSISTKTSLEFDQPVRRSAHEERSTGVQLSQETKRLDAFYEAQQQRLNDRLRANRSAESNGRPPSLPKSGGIDHHAIDVLLSRNYPEQVDNIRVELNGTGREATHIKTTGLLTTVQVHGEIPIIGDDNSEESIQPTESEGGVGVEVEKCFVMDEHDVYHARRETGQPITDTTGKSLSPRLTRVAYRTTRKSGTVDFVASSSEKNRVADCGEKSASQAAEGQNGVIPMHGNNLAKLTDQGQKVDQNSASVGWSKTEEPPTVEPPTVSIEGGPLLYHPVSVSRDAKMDQGPWSRESFDLFGWRPKDTASINPVLQ